MWKGIRNPKSHVEMPGATACGYQRERFTTKKDDDELRTESLFTQTTLLLQKNEELIAWNEAHRKEDEVCATTAAETLRKSGRRIWRIQVGTHVLEPRGGREPEETVHTDRERHTTCCVDRRMHIPLEWPLLESQKQTLISP